MAGLFLEEDETLLACSPHEKLYDWFISYGDVLWGLGQKVNLSRGWSYHGEGLLPTRQPRLGQSKFRQIVL